MYMVTTSLMTIFNFFEIFDIFKILWTLRKKINFRILKFFENFEILWNLMNTEIFEIFWRFWNLMKILNSCEHFEFFLKFWRKKIKFQEFSLIGDEVRVFRINIKHLSNPDTALKFRETVWRYRSNSKKIWTGQ